jgi:hypothetical protein
MIAKAKIETGPVTGVLQDKPCRTALRRDWPETDVDQPLIDVGSLG